MGIYDHKISESELQKLADEVRRFNNGHLKNAIKQYASMSRHDMINSTNNNKIELNVWDARYKYMLLEEERRNNEGWDDGYDNKRKSQPTIKYITKFQYDIFEKSVDVAYEDIVCRFVVDKDTDESREHIANIMLYEYDMTKDKYSLVAKPIHILDC